jgi:hypothetical protein
MSPNTITIGECRLSYCNVFKPQPPFNNPAGEPKFSVTILVPKSNTAAKAAIDAAVNAAIETGVSTKWNGQRPPMPAISVHDGDGVRPSDGMSYGPECKGCWVMTASCAADRPPFVVDGSVQKIIDPTQVYSGCYGNVSVTFFAYNSAGKKGIGCGLNGIQKTRDGEPLGSTVTAEEAFGVIAPAQTSAPAGWGAPAPAAQPQAPAGWGAPAPAAQPQAPAGWGAPAPAGWPNIPTAPTGWPNA